MKMTCNVLEPHINGMCGRTISPEMMGKAIKEYLERPDTKLLYMDNGSDRDVENPFLLSDAVGTLDSIERRDDGSFIAECTINTILPKGKVISEMWDNGFAVQPHGYYLIDDDKLTIVDFSIN